MRLYDTRWAQILITVLYPVAIFGLLSDWNMLSPWVIVVVLLLFCALWGNMRYLMLSTIIMILTAVPLWWFFIAQSTPQAQDLIGWYPLIVVNFLLFVLLPEIVIVLGRNAVLRRFAMRQHVQ